jgi:RNA-directed DNA polymerase
MKFRAPHGPYRTRSTASSGSPHGPWRIANSPALAMALPDAYFAKLGRPPMVVRSYA